MSIDVDFVIDEIEAWANAKDNYEKANKEFRKAFDQVKCGARSFKSSEDSEELKALEAKVSEFSLLIKQKDISLRNIVLTRKHLREEND